MASGGLLMGDKKPNIPPITEKIQEYVQKPSTRELFGGIPIVSDVIFGTFTVMCYLFGMLFDLIATIIDVLLRVLWAAIDSIILAPLADASKKGAYYLADQSIIPRDIIDMVFRYADSFGDFKSIATILMSLGMGKNLLDTLTQIPMFYTQRYLMERFRPQLPQPAEIMRAAFVAPEKIDMVWDILQKQGYPEEYIKLLFVANYNTYDENMIRELYLRKVLNEDEMMIRMRELGYTDTRIKEITQAWDIIPGPADLLMMVAKEAFEPDEIQRYGLMDEFPSDQVEWLEKQGLSKYWQEKYWAAHWDYPSYQQVIEMLHRGKITEEDVYQYYRIVEIPKYWRDLLTSIQYQPYTRVDVRRMHKLGVVGDEELIRAYMDQGYDLEHAKGMAEFTVKYNQTEDKALTRAQIEKGYKTGIIKRDEARTMLIEIDYVPHFADFILDQLDFDIKHDYIQEAIDVIGEQYKNNLISEQEATRKLYELDLPAAKVDGLFNQWDLRKVENLRLPTKTDLESMLMYSIIEPDDYIDIMYRLGYSMQHIEWYIKLFYYKLSETLEETEGG